MTDNEKDTGLPEERPQPASAQNDTAPETAADADIPAAEETAAPEETPNTEEAPKAEKPSEPAETVKEETAPEAETPKEETPKEEAPETAEPAGYAEDCVCGREKGGERQGGRPRRCRPCHFALRCGALQRRPGPFPRRHPPGQHLRPRR